MELTNDNISNMVDMAESNDSKDHVLLYNIIKENYNNNNALKLLLCVASIWKQDHEDIFHFLVEANDNTFETLWQGDSWEHLKPEYTHERNNIMMVQKGKCLEFYKELQNII